MKLNTFELLEIFEPLKKSYITGSTRYCKVCKKSIYHKEYFIAYSNWIYIECPKCKQYKGCY